MMKIFKKIVKKIEIFKKNRIFRKKIAISENNVQTFLNFSKTIFDVCESEFKDLSQKIQGTIKISLPNDKHQNVYDVALRDIMKTKLNIRASLTSDISEIYETLTKTNESNNTTIPINGKGKPGNRKNSTATPVSGDINIEIPIIE